MDIIHTSCSLSAPVVRAPLRSGPPLLQALALHCNLHGRPLLQGVDLVLGEGSFVVLHGDNGAGKSTLLELLHGRRRPSMGSVFFAVHPTPSRSAGLLCCHSDPAPVGICQWMCRPWLIWAQD